MEHIYKIDVEEFVESITRKIIERLSDFEINNGEITRTRIEVIQSDGEAEIDS